MNKEIHFDEFGHLVMPESQDQLYFDEFGHIAASRSRDRKTAIKGGSHQPPYEIITDTLLGTATGLVSALLYDAVKTNMLAKAQEKSQMGPTIFDDPLMRFEQFRGSELPSDIDAMRSLFGS